MKIKVVFLDGDIRVGEYRGHKDLPPQDRLPAMLNDDRKFFPFWQLNGVVLELNKAALKYVAREI